MEDNCCKLYMLVLLFLLLPSHCDTKMLKIHSAEWGAFYLTRVVSQVIAVFSRLNPTGHLLSGESMTGNPGSVSFQLYVAFKVRWLSADCEVALATRPCEVGLAELFCNHCSSYPVIPFSWWDPAFPWRALPSAHMFQGWVLAVALISHGWSRFWHLACSLLCLPAPRQLALLTPVQLLVLVSQGHWNLWPSSFLVPWAGTGRGWARLCQGQWCHMSTGVPRAVVSHGHWCPTRSGVTRLLSVFGNSWRPQAVSCSLTRPCLGTPPATPALPPTLRGRPSSTPGSTCTVTRPNGAVHPALTPGLTWLCLFSWLSISPLSSLSLSRCFSKEWGQKLAFVVFGLSPLVPKDTEMNEWMNVFPGTSQRYPKKLNTFLLTHPSEGYSVFLNQCVIYSHWYY